MDQAEIVKTLNEQFPGSVVEEQKAGIVINKDSLLSVARYLKESELAFESCHCITAVDRKEKFEIIYLLYSFKHHLMLTLKVFVSRENPEVETITHFWRSADWLEREQFDFFGIKFLHHPDLRRILNPDEWTDWPLRKDFDRPDFYRLPPVEGLK